MRPRLWEVLTGAGLGVVLASLGGIAALGATPNLTFYLVGDSEPIGSMSTASPPDIVLSNYDPGRDTASGLVLARSALGVAESDPTKYQQWEVDADSANLSISKFSIWGAMRSFDKLGTGLFGVYLLDCATSCTVLESRIKSVKGTNNWSRITVPFSTEHKFDPGHSLAVKVVVLSDSDDDMWFAYGTATYAAHVLARDVPGATTTTTTTVPPVPTTVAGADSTTTSTSATSTTLGSGGVGGTPPTTTVSNSDGSGDSAGAASSTPGADLIISLPERPQVIANSSGAETLATEMPVAETLSPQQGLMVAFATVAQTFQAQLIAAVALGLFGSLLILAIQRRQDDDPDVTPTSEPGSWWFSG